MRQPFSHIQGKTLFTFFYALIPSLLFSSASYAHWYQHNDTLMGTSINIEIWHEDKAKAHDAINNSLDIFRDVEKSMSPYIADSELSRINDHAFSTDVTLTPELFFVIEKSLWASNVSKGAFDITFASVGYLYNYKTGQKPVQDDIKNRLPAINYQTINLDKDNNTLRFMHEKTRIDLGGIAKGYAIDKVITHLESVGIKHAVVSAGGDTRILGDKRGKPWIIGIKDPRQTEKSLLVIPLENTAISTSGDYERFFIIHDQRYHHIIDPDTGYSPTHEIQSVSIIGPDAIITDALSTTVFILGLNDGMTLIDSLTDYDAIIITEGTKIHFSKGLQQPH